MTLKQLFVAASLLFATAAAHAQQSIEIRVESPKPLKVTDIAIWSPKAK